MFTAKQIIQKMDEIEQKYSDDPETMHSKLDDLLMKIVPKSVAIRYLEIQEKSPYWGCA